MRVAPRLFGGAGHAVVHGNTGVQHLTDEIVVHQRDDVALLFTAHRFANSTPSPLT